LPVPAQVDQVTFEAAPAFSYPEELARVGAPGKGERATAMVMTSAAPHDFRRGVADLVARMARRTEEALAATLKQATSAWDQADALSVIDGALQAEIAATRSRLAAGAQGTASSASRAVALEGLLVVDASVALVRVFEQRLAVLMRLRLRSATPELLPEGRPFLDLGRALHEVAEAWR
jgi:hypothetical protein